MIYANVAQSRKNRNLWFPIFRGCSRINILGIGRVPEKVSGYTLKTKIRECSSVGRARPCQGRGREFESHHSLYAWLNGLFGQEDERQRAFYLLDWITLFSIKGFLKKEFILNHEEQKIKPVARVVELVDTLDLKSSAHCERAGSIPAPGTE